MVCDNYRQGNENDNIVSNNSRERFVFASASPAWFYKIIDYAIRTIIAESYPGRNAIWKGALAFIIYGGPVLATRGTCYLQWYAWVIFCLFVESFVRNRQTQRQTVRSRTSQTEHYFLLDEIEIKEDLKGGNTEYKRFNESAHTTPGERCEEGQ